MKSKEEKLENGRRDFLKASVIAGAGTAIAAGGVAPVSAAVADMPVEDTSVEEGYRLTQHIVDYYKTAAS